MHKTVYIDVDEEIIGIIRKVKQAEAAEVFLVVPKNSLLTQGIVNLKLLKKEVDKMGKEVILVTSDKHSREIIEKMGLKTKNKSVQDFVGGGNQENDDMAERKIKSQEFSYESTPKVNKKRVIGSNSFYNSSEGESEEEENVPKFEFEEDGENNSLIPPKPSGESRKIRVNQENSFGQEYVDNREHKDKIEEENRLRELNFNQEESNDFEKGKAEPVKKEFDFITQSKQESFEDHEATIKDFYQSHFKDKKEKTSNSIKNKPKRKSFQISNKKKFAFFVVFIFIFFLSGMGFWVYSNWPKMEVQLFPKEKIEETNFDLLVCDDKEAGENCLSGDYQELVIEVSENYDSSGEKFSNDKGMARGIVKIYNNYSSRPQALVATTRLMSEEGKLFRLIKGVTVPGMDGDQPGVVEAQVIADKIGQNYNINPTEFKIEGFKGGDKYDKFKVISENPMVGGANDTDNKKVKVVTENDISSAREKTIDLFNEKLEENIKNKIDSSETFVTGSIEKEIMKSDSSYAPGDIIDRFNYTVRQKIKLITFNKNEFDDIIKKSFDEKISEDLVMREIKQIDFQKDVADYQEKELDLSVKAEAVYWPIIDELKIKRELASREGEEIKNYLTGLNQIEKAIISYNPSWLSFVSVKEKNILIKEIR